jgi:predicted phage replisome organizer
MADVKWIKIVTDIFDDEKIRFIETLPQGDSMIVIWFKILCMCGKSNKGGYLMMTDKIAYTDEMLSSIFNKNINFIQLCINTFKSLDMIEVVDNRYYVSNWEKHQSVEKLDQIREMTRIRVARHREKQQQLELSSNVTVTQNVTQCNALDKDKEIDKDKEEDLFNLFWKAYPKKKSKGNAEKWFKKNKPNKALVDLMIAKIEELKKTKEWQKEKGQFIPYPASWLNSKGWEDEVIDSNGKMIKDKPEWYEDYEKDLKAYNISKNNNKLVNSQEVASLVKDMFD